MPIWAVKLTAAWPLPDADLDSRTTFLGTSAGFNLPGGTYLNWLGDSQGFGGEETTVVDLYDSWKAHLFTMTTKVGVGADWYIPDHGSGPATISVALEDIHTEKEYQIQSVVVSVAQRLA